MVMLRSGERRHRLARTLNAAYGEGLLSETTLAHRLELLFGSRLIDPQRVIGDLSFRAPFALWARLVQRVRRGLPVRSARPSRLLALDWDGCQEELVVGRDPVCDIVLADRTVSRRHARLLFRDGIWTLRDLDSTNGTRVNRVSVERCQLHPGDHLQLGDEHLLID